MEMSCLTSSYFSSIDNGISPLAPGFTLCSLCKSVVHRFDLPFQSDLSHAELVDPLIVARNALLEQTGQLPLDRRAFAKEPVFPKFQHAIRKNPGRGLRLAGDGLDQRDL